MEIKQMGEEKISKTASDIILALKDSRNLISAADIKKKTLIESWNTLQWNLNKLEQIGRIHTKIIGTKKYYALNGKGVHQHSIQLDNNNYLWVDIFEPRNVKEHFVRIKQSQKVGPEKNDWETKGKIVVTKEAFQQLLDTLKKTKEVLEKEYWN